MKRLFGLAGLALALSGCLVIVEDPTAQGSFTGGSFRSEYSNVGESQYYVCGNKSTFVDVSFSWTGDLKEYALEFYGKSNPNTVVRSPSSGFFQVSGRPGISVESKTGVETFLFFQNPNDPNDPANVIRPLSDNLRTQAVVVTPIPNPTINTLGATKVRILGRDSFGNPFSLNVSGEIQILTADSQGCQ
jgi:hypothetical protein